ncbi:MAG: hypothetical protein KC910_37670, partial [Candidatus Eremiobacteraeota bacterium]|nr:hypothetical protein [Candidatus Eremiobacteraeota bacterium]
MLVQGAVVVDSFGGYKVAGEGRLVSIDGSGQVHWTKVVDERCSAPLCLSDGSTMVSGRSICTHVVFSTALGDSQPTNLALLEGKVALVCDRVLYVIGDD